MSISSQRKPQVVILSAATEHLCISGSIHGVFARYARSEGTFKETGANRWDETLLQDFRLFSVIGGSVGSVTGRTVVPSISEQSQ